MVLSCLIKSKASPMIKLTYKGQSSCSLSLLKMCYSMDSNSSKIIEFMHSYKKGEVDDMYIPRPPKKKTAKDNTPMPFICETKVKAQAGNGGKGLIKFLHAPKKEFAGPSGGDGGNGGHVIFEVCQNVQSLARLKGSMQAVSGDPGQHKEMTGKSAEDLWVKVPLGTCLYRDGIQQTALDREGLIYLAARGGSGGKGNRFFATSTDQAPRVAEAGGVGESIEYDVIMKVMAHVGLIGFPNAGKSTLLRAISRARPEVSEVAFSTTVPHIGSIEYQDYEIRRVADIPGIVKDAHLDVGLGVGFLEYITRCNSLLYVIDLTDKDPVGHLEILRNELEHFQKGFSKRPSAVVANKIDVPGAETNLALLSSAFGLPVIPVSAKFEKNIAPLQALIRFISQLPTN